MRSKRTKQFRKLLDQLPSDAQQLAHEAYRQFLADTSYPGFDFKQVSKKGPTYSVRSVFIIAHLPYGRRTTGSGFGSDRTPSTITSSIKFNR